MSINIANLRKLLTAAKHWRAEMDRLGRTSPITAEQELQVAAVNALPELLDEVERLRDMCHTREDAANQFCERIAKLEAEVKQRRIEVGELEDSRAKERDESAEVVKAQRERIAQLEAALRFYGGADLNGQPTAFANRMAFDLGAKARAALEGRE